jgi:hypothetical protein
MAIQVVTIDGLREMQQHSAPSPTAGITPYLVVYHDVFQGIPSSVTETCNFSDANSVSAVPIYAIAVDPSKPSSLPQPPLQVPDALPCVYVHSPTHELLDQSYAPSTTRMRHLLWKTQPKPTVDANSALGSPLKPSSSSSVPAQPDMWQLAVVMDGSQRLMQLDADKPLMELFPSQYTVFRTAPPAPRVLDSSKSARENGLRSRDKIMVS